MKEKFSGINFSLVFIWAVYASLLLVLFPHTVWAFELFEPAEPSFTIFGASPTAVFAAISFELAIVVFTHKLGDHLEAMPRYRVMKKKLIYQWANIYVFGILVFVGISMAANILHAKTFAADSFDQPWYFVPFGGILPLASLLFARLISKVNISEAEDDPELAKAKKEVKELKALLKSANKETEEAEKQRKLAQQRFEAVGDLAAMIFGDAPTKDRILAIRHQWPKLNNAAIAQIADTSPGYVSDIMKKVEAGDIQVLDIQ